MRLSALDPKALSPEQRFILTALRMANGVCGADDLRRAAKSDLNWDAIVTGMDRHGLLWVTNALLDVAGIVPTAAEVALKQRARQSAIATFLRIEETVKIARAFDAAGLRYLMIKGVPLSVQLYHDPARRSGRDIDVLVAPEDMASADAILNTLGYGRPDEDKAKDIIAGHKAKELGYLHQDHRTLVEVHDRLTDNATLLPWDFEDLWDDRELVNIGPAQIPTMNYARLAVYLSAHGTKHCWARMMWLNDIIALTPTAAAVDAALAEARTIGTEGVMAHTLEMLDAWLGHTVLMARPSSTRQIRWMNALTMRFHRDPIWHDYAPRNSWRRFWQNSVLSRSMAYVMKRDWRYRLMQMEIELSSPADRAILDLPPHLVWLYPFFRPFGWIIRRLKRGGAAS